MKMSIEKSAGISLMCGSLLLVVTMVLHPAGGSLDHLLKATKFIIVSHSIALVALPFLAAGFWGFTKKLGTENFISVSAFAVVVFGLIAGMIAATINGLALPIFINHYADAAPAAKDILKMILRNNISFNQAFDFVFIGAICLSVLLYSIANLLTKKIPLLVSYLGIILILVIIALLVSGFVMVNLHGFRFFIIALVIWIGLAAIALMRSEV